VKSLSNPRDKAELLQRLRTLQPDSARQWGRMSAHQMVCHLADAFIMGTDQKPVSSASGFRERTILKWFALYAPFRWPPGRINTRPEVDQEIGGTKPIAFATDVSSLEALVEIVTTRPGFFAGRHHPIFGSLSEPAWMRWGYLHMDHHLRQFGA
jgi:hypothetical protein